MDDINNDYGGEPMDQMPMDNPVGPEPMPQQPVNPYARPTRPVRGYGQPMQTQMQQPMNQPMMQGYNQMSYEQPIEPYGPEMVGMQPMQGTSGNRSFSSKLVFVVVMVLITGLIFAGLIFLPNILGGGSSDGIKKVTKEMVKSYCEKNNYIEIDLGADSNDEIEDSYSCVESTGTAGGDGLAFVKYNKPALDSSMSDTFKTAEEKGYLSVIEEGKEYYMQMYGSHYYLVVDNDEVFMVITTNKDEIQKILDEVRGESSKNAKYKEEIVKDTANIELEALQRSQRDTVRRNDISRVDTSLVQYQTNHSRMSDNLPGYGTFLGWEDFKAENRHKCNSTACEFIRDYMNAGSSNNEGDNKFKDPDGTPYKMVITSNWGNDEWGDERTLVNTTYNDKSKLVSDGDGGYTIGGEDPFKEHVIYVVPGGRCENGSVIKSTRRHFAVLYRLEGAGVYCIDDQ